ncbi:MAG: purine-nucleoside phosphorylase [Xanthomonadales bacterium]|nr:purine-nucleoside phosphorylase [Xanthomonadales bacterium]
MSAKQLADQLAGQIRQRSGDQAVDIGLILGSGLAGFVAAVEDPVKIPYAELAGFPATGVEGHNPELIIGTIEGVRVAVLGGRSHYYENGQADAMRLPLETLKALGANTLLATNSAGSAHLGISPGQFMLINDHLNLAGANPLQGESSNQRFVDMTNAYDPDLRAAVKRGAESEGIDLQEGVYAWFSGPSFETPAEVRMAHILGADAVGMSTAAEVILARFLGMKAVAISNITNAGAGLSEISLSHSQTQQAAATSAIQFETLLRAFLRQFNEL